jgi:hypothetical protein
MIKHPEHDFVQTRISIEVFAPTQRSGFDERLTGMDAFR